MIGSTSRRGGKTRLACSLISKFNSQCEIFGIKITTIHDSRSGCPHGRSGCGVCAELDGRYCITEETDNKADKDTCKMLAAGASRVFWVRVLRAHLEDAITALLDIIGRNTVSICESNSLRRVVEPGVFVMVEASSGSRKTSAQEVSQYVDRNIFYDGSRFDIEFDEIGLAGGRWSVKLNATAIVVAGGASRRMGEDKSMLPVGNKPMIEFIVNQLRPNFEEIIISANDPGKYAFLGLKVVSDEIAGRGPLVGIASALKASANEANFVTACDIPEIDMALVRQMLRQSCDVDAVVPRTGPSQHEPLFAVYKKNCIAAIDAALLSGNNRVIDSLSRCNVKYFDLPDKQMLKNINTMDEYLEFVRRQVNAAV